MKAFDIVITGLQAWDIPIGSNAIDIARELSLKNRVLYVNSALDVITVLKGSVKPEEEHRLQVLKKKEQPIRQISESLWVADPTFAAWPVNSLPDGPLFDFINRINNKRLVAFIKKTAATLNFKSIIHFIDNDIYRSQYAKNYLKPRLSVYYRRDNLQPFEYWKRHAGRIEPLLIAKSDLVVCNSPQLAAFAQQFNPNTYDIGQGLDLAAFTATLPSAKPLMFNAIPKPIIGYIGDINSLRLDPDLIYNLAKQKPACSFVLIGPEDAVFKAHPLHTLSNVHFTGRIPKDQVALHMSAFDVCINPQKINEITIGNYPRKVDEYLAMGKPVLATKTETMDLFKNHVYLCTTIEDYSQALEKALNETDKQLELNRRQFAQSHSWEANVKAILNLIIKTLN